MPFKAPCPYCATKMKFPDSALGTSIRCPRCGNSFTAAPPEDFIFPWAGSNSATLTANGTAKPGSWVDEDAPSVPRESEAPPSSPLEGLRPRRKPAGKAPAKASSKSDATPLPPTKLPPPKPGSFPDVEFLGKPIPRWINAWAVVALAMGGVGLACASLDVTRILTIPLASAGVLTVVIGFLGHYNYCRARDVAWYVAGLTLCLGVLVTAVFWPHLLNKHWGSDYQVVEQDTNQFILVSRDNRVTANPVKDGDWVDASKHAVRQGDVHVVVDKVVLDYAPLKDTSKDKSKLLSYLITLRVGNVGHLKQVMYESTSQRPELRDSRGKSYELRKFAPGTLAVNQTDKEILPPHRYLEDLLVFEAPVAVESLELSVPAAIWGGEGSCHFRIPKEMIAVKAKR